jgi:transcription elongation factor Elf1
MTVKLLPCPFCGASEVKLYQNCNMSWVACISCGLEAPSETGVTNVQAVNYWNTRASSSVSDHQSAISEQSAVMVSPPPSTSQGARTPPENVADRIIGEIEARFPNWQSYRDLIDCIDCTLHELRRQSAFSREEGSAA